MPSRWSEIPIKPCRIDVQIKIMLCENVSIMYVVTGEVHRSSGSTIIWHFFFTEWWECLHFREVHRYPNRASIVSWMTNNQSTFRNTSKTLTTDDEHPLFLARKWRILFVSRFLISQINYWSKLEDLVVVFMRENRSRQTSRISSDTAYNRSFPLTSRLSTSLSSEKMCERFRWR